MSIKRSESVRDEISLFGEWWLPSNPEKRLHGVLKGSVATEFTLDIRGGFETASPNVTIHGETKDNERVTLSRCLAPDVPPEFFGTGGPVSTSYDVGLLIRGAWIEAQEENLCFRRVSFGLHLLENWHAANAFNPMPLNKSLDSKEKNEKAIYQRPEPVELAHHDGLRVILEYKVGLPGWSLAQTSMTLEHGARIAIETNGKIASLFDDADDNSPTSFFQIIETLRRFFSFAFGASTFPYDIVGVVEKATGQSSETFVQILWTQSIPEILPQRRFFAMDLRIDFLRGDPKPIIQRWLAFDAETCTAIAFYLDVTCGAIKYLDTQAANLCQALEAYHRRANPDLELPNKKLKKKIADILDSAPTKSRHWLKRKLEHSHAPSLQERIKGLIKRYPKTTEWLLGDDKEQEPFLRWAVEKRNAYSHARRAKYADAKKLDSLTEDSRVQFLRALLFMCLLSDLDYSESDIDEIVKWNQCFGRAMRQRVSPRDPKIIHVTGKRRDWSVYSQGIGYCFGFATKREALKKGRSMARAVGGKLIVHKLDGSVQETINYDASSVRKCKPRPQAKE